jgi:hypothetical protein
VIVTVAVIALQLVAASRAAETQQAASSGNMLQQRGAFRVIRVDPA